MMMMRSDDNKLSTLPPNQQCPQMMMMMMKMKDKSLLSTSTTVQITKVDEEEKQGKKVGGLKCPRCNSSNTKFCYYNNYSLSQPRHFCKSCKRYWTLGGSLRNVPIGGSSRKNKRLIKPRRHPPYSSPPPPPNPFIFTDMISISTLNNTLNDPNYTSIVNLPNSFPCSSIDDQLPSLGLIYSSTSTDDDHFPYNSSFNHDNSYQPSFPLDYNHLLPCDNNDINLTSDHHHHSSTTTSSNDLYWSSGSDICLQLQSHQLQTLQ